MAQTTCHHLCSALLGCFGENRVKVQDKIKVQDESIAQTTYATMFGWAAQASVRSFGRRRRLRKNKMNPPLLELSASPQLKMNAKLINWFFNDKCTLHTRDEHFTLKYLELELAPRALVQSFYAESVSGTIRLSSKVSKCCFFRKYS